MRKVELVLSLICLFWLINAGFSFNLLSPKGVNFEVAALMSVKKGMLDENHVLDGWDINSVDPCTWNMVGCSPEGFVISLEMASMGLSGTLSRSIGNLTHLRTMLLQNNQLSGDLPYEIGKLSELQTLDLSGNQFDGEIPSSLGDLSRLSYFFLPILSSISSFSTMIPNNVTDTKVMSCRDLSSNNLSGSIPNIRAKDYSVAGNIFLCSASSEICVAAPKPVNETNTYTKVKDHHHHHMVIAIAIGVGCSVSVSILLLVFWVHWYRSRAFLKSEDGQDYEFDMGQLKRFSLRELQIATNHFNSKNILGQGGFGVVYKGILPNRTVVAVKRLKDPSFTGEMQFQTEVEMIGLALHRNLLRLYGFCMTPEEKLLVYPYMPNGSVADRLRDPGRERPSLDWSKRMRIALGASRGLLYLHEQCNPKIIHRDVKAANILLDESFEAVVGDFGLAKLLDPRDSHVTTAVRGTAGHIAPEYLSTGQSSEKTDVFGFGMLLLELITGLKPLDARAPDGQVHKGMILEWVRTLYGEKKVDELVDKHLKGSFNSDELAKAVELALQCTQSNPEQRPRMSQVLRVLEGINGQADPTEALSPVDLCQGRTFSFSWNFSEARDDSSVSIEAIELSGPR
ncbi:Probable LRR receptor-like serine/threonine-protein kinase [Striga hermonthica]|uniref:non-specific serine/threonine protein kinase n=1 Tax=Striga hermonthica TaxID=68872 RepID=A0A9N7NNM5_STRHE|nr:Probable LRR receptor-like serine/threonine-protein kinase [Striga hermonthica]